MNIKAENCWKTNLRVMQSSKFIKTKFLYIRDIGMSFD